MTKPELRKISRSSVAELSVFEKKEYSSKACSLFLQSELFSTSDIVFSYAATPSEIDPQLISRAALSKGKILAFPKTVPGTSDMDFYLAPQERKFESFFTEGAWGIKEPDCGCELFLPESESFKKICAHKKICVIVPGVAFSCGGTRLGHGKGFYDIYLERLLNAACLCGAEVFLVGMCFSCQLQDSVPAESHDAVMNFILSEKSFFSVG